MKPDEVFSARHSAAAGGQEAISTAVRIGACSGRSRDVGPAGMVVQVLQAAARSSDGGLLEWLDAWGTAAVIDGRIDGFAVFGKEMSPNSDLRSAILSAIDRAARCMAGRGRSRGDRAHLTIRGMEDETIALVVVLRGDLSGVVPTWEPPSVELVCHTRQNVHIGGNWSTVPSTVRPVDPVVETSEWGRCS